MSRLETNGYYALGAPMYLVLVAIEYFVARRRGVRVFRLADSIGNLSAGLGEVILGIFLGPLLIALYDFGYAHIALVHWPEGSPWTWVAAFLLADFCYYVYHRAGHRFAAFWSIHGVHHQSEEFNVTVAMRHPWLSDSYSAIFYVPLPLLGIPPTHFFVAITIISFYALTIHTRFFHRPSLYVFTTPRTHVLHHATNPRYIGKNLGAMFTIWDRLFGTYVEPDPEDVPKLGTRTGYLTHDGALAQWVFPRQFLRILRRAPSWRSRLAVLIGPPGYLPDGVTLPPEPRARPHEAIGPETAAYGTAQFAMVVGFGVYVLWARDTFSTGRLIVASGLVLFGLFTIGGVFDGRARADAFEKARHGLYALVGILWSMQGLREGIALLAIGLLGGVASAVSRRRGRDRTSGFADAAEAATTARTRT